MWKSKLLLAGAAALAISLGSVASAQADYGWHLDKVDYFDDDGDWVEFWSDGEGRTLIFIIEDGETIGYLADGFDNPNPEEGSGSEDDWDHLTDLLKKHGAGLKRMVNLAGTPLGDVLLRGGHLIDPYHNPGDAGFEDTGGSGGGGFTPGAGSPTEQLKRHAGKGNKSKGDGEDGDDLKRGEAGLFDDDMPGPPEIVNPNPVSRSYKLDNGGRGHDGPQGNNGGGGAGGGMGGGGTGGAAAR